MFFDQNVIRKEFESLPDGERARLVSLMRHYEQAGFGNPSPAVIDDYGDGIKRLRHVKPAYQGRALFFSAESRTGYERLVVLTVFKEESQKVPKHVLARAKERKAVYEAERKDKP